MLGLGWGMGGFGIEHGPWSEESGDRIQNPGESVRAYDAGFKM
jgi:hypothetical protein